MTRLLVIGQNPAPVTQLNPNNIPFHRTVCEWLDAVGVHYYSFMNVQSEPGQFSPTFSDLKLLNEALKAHHGPVLVLGTRAQMAVKMLGHHFFPGPHPSGLNRLLNDAEYVADFIYALQAFINKDKGHVYRAGKAEFQSVLRADTDARKERVR